jgi:hypothetical protein
MPWGQRRIERDKIMNKKLILILSLIAAGSAVQASDANARKGSNPAGMRISPEESISGYTKVYKNKVGGSVFITRRGGLVPFSDLFAMEPQMVQAAKIQESREVAKEAVTKVEKFLHENAMNGILHPSFVVRAAAYGDLDALQRWCMVSDSGEAVRRDRYAGFTPLHVAAMFERTEIVQFLVDAGVKKDVLSDNELTASELLDRFTESGVSAKHLFVALERGRELERENRARLAAEEKERKEESRRYIDNLLKEIKLEDKARMEKKKALKQNMGPPPVPARGKAQGEKKASSATKERKRKNSATRQVKVVAAPVVAQVGLPATAAAGKPVRRRNTKKPRKPVAKPKAVRQGKASSSVDQRQAAQRMILQQQRQQQQLVLQHQLELQRQNAEKKRRNAAQPATAAGATELSRDTNGNRAIFSGLLKRREFLGEELKKVSSLKFRRRVEEELNTIAQVLKDMKDSK